MDPNSTIPTANNEEFMMDAVPVAARLTMAVISEIIPTTPHAHENRKI